MWHVSLLFIFHIIVTVNGFFNPYHKTNVKYDDGGDPGSPLFLTPYLEQGNIEEARNLSRVHIPEFPNITSYAGLFTVDKKYNSNQFFWYFPPEESVIGAGVFVWLQGGPCTTSLYGLFEEHGSFVVRNNTLSLREIRWSIFDHFIYIDNPVGAGFSFTEDPRGYCTDQVQIGEHLYSTLIQFFQLFPKLQKRPLIISGESYAGKYIPALGYTIHKKNPTAKTKINLKGLMIGNGWCDPINQLEYGAFLYQIGLIDWNTKKKAERLQNRTINLIKKEAWSDATHSLDILMSVLKTAIGHISLHNYMKLEFDEGCEYCQLVQSSAMRKAIHVGNLTFDDTSHDAWKSLRNDTMKSVAPWISELLEHYPIMFYNGQVDIMVTYPSTVNFIRNMKFSGSEDYLKARRDGLAVFKSKKKSQIGFMKADENYTLTDVLLRNAGHMVPVDQPKWIQLTKDFWYQHVRMP